MPLRFKRDRLLSYSFSQLQNIVVMGENEMGQRRIRTGGKSSACGAAQIRSFALDRDTRSGRTTTAVTGDGLTCVTREGPNLSSTFLFDHPPTVKKWWYAADSKRAIAHRPPKYSGHRVHDRFTWCETTGTISGSASATCVGEHSASVASTSSAPALTRQASSLATAATIAGRTRRVA